MKIKTAVPGEGQKNNNVRDSWLLAAACTRDSKTVIYFFCLEDSFKQWRGKQYHKKNWFWNHWIRLYNCTELNKQPRSGHRKHSYWFGWNLPNLGSVINYQDLFLCEIIRVPTDTLEVTSSVKLHCKAMFLCSGGVFLLQLMVDVENNGNQTRKRNAMEEAPPSVKHWAWCTAVLA